MSQLERYILIGLATIFVVVFLRWLKRFLRRNEIHESFPYLHPFANSVLTETELLTFDLPSTNNVKAEVFSESGVMVLLLFEESLKAGNHQKAIGLGALQKGDYTLKITFSNQITSRPFKLV